MPQNKTDIQSALVHPNCMCLKSNRKTSGLLSPPSQKKGSESLMWENMFKSQDYTCTRLYLYYKILISAAQDPPSFSSKAANILLWEKGQRGLHSSSVWNTESQLIINDRDIFEREKLSCPPPPTPQVNLFPCIIIPINKLFYSYSTTDISV